MGRNVEIKARVDDLDVAARRVAAIADEGPTEIDQDDTFFRCVDGRLKLRAFADGSAELIWYRRPDEDGPKESLYVRSRASEPGSLREVLARAYGIAGRVRKRRTLYLVGRTRVHLDRVEGLGDFLELEVVLREGESLTIGAEEADALARRLGVDPSRWIRGAYADLMAETPVQVHRVPITSDAATSLIRALNAELAETYPEPGATSFRLASDEVREGNGAFVVAYDREIPVGCGGIRRIDADTAEIKRMFVEAGARGRGIGRAVLERLEEEGRDLGARRIVLETGVRQEAAIALYTRAGYEPVPPFGEYVRKDRGLSLCLGKEIA